MKVGTILKRLAQWMQNSYKIEVNKTQWEN